MSTSASALPKDQTALPHSALETLFEPIAEELLKTQELYRQSVLDTSEREYIHELLLGNTNSFIPEEFRVSTVDRIAAHLLQSEGKWLRAALCLLSADACGQRGVPVHQVAVAVELVHLATLIHDDIIDQAPMRRGIQSISGGWGNSIAVLLGDFLFSKAFKLLLASESIPAQNMLTRATGQMCLGEIKQLRFATDTQYTEADYLEMIEHKTASLMSSATASGCQFGDVTEETAKHFHEYGFSLGMAFQITDDVLDYTSNTSTLGKEVCGDLRNGKVTLPLIHLREQNGNAKDVMEENLPVEEKSKRLTEMMESCGSFTYASLVGQRYGERAKTVLDQVEQAHGSSASLQCMKQIVDFVLNRKW